MKCVHCSTFNDETAIDEMKTHEIKRVINEFAKMGGVVLDISGGEPLTHPDLFEIIEYAHSKGLRTKLYTSGLFPQKNGTLSQITCCVAEKLKKSGLNKIIFNLQGACKKTHESITRVDGSFEKVINSIKLMKSLGFWIGVHFVPMKTNYKELRNTIQLCHDLKVNEFGVLRFVPQGRGRKNKQWLELSRDEFIQLIYEIVKLRHSFDDPTIKIGRPFNFCSIVDDSLKVETCNAGISTCLIKPNGDVAPCPAFKQNPNYVAGNIRNISLAEIWHISKIWEQFRLFDYKKLKGSCKKCNHLERCKGRCIAQRILSYGDIYQGPDPYCLIAYEEEICAKKKYPSILRLWPPGDNSNQV